MSGIRKCLEELRLGSQTTEEIEAFAAALDSHGPSAPRPQEHADLSYFFDSVPAVGVG